MKIKSGTGKELIRTMELIEEKGEDEAIECMRQTYLMQCNYISRT
jgi:hypothetical protein